MEVACTLGRDTTNVKTKKQWTKTDTELVKQTLSKWTNQKFKLCHVPAFLLWSMFLNFSVQIVCLQFVLLQHCQQLSGQDIL